MLPQNRTFILSEAERCLPLVRPMLIQIRQMRARLSRLDRQLERVDWNAEEELALRHQRWQAWETLQRCLEEAEQLGVIVTSGIRCEVLFPFEHRWIGPRGDHKIRPAFFVYNDSFDSIDHWFFSGWPRDRRVVSENWRSVQRPRETHSAAKATS